MRRGVLQRCLPRAERARRSQAPVHWAVRDRRASPGSVQGTPFCQRTRVQEYCCAHMRAASLARACVGRAVLREARRLYRQVHALQTNSMLGFAAKVDAPNLWHRTDTIVRTFQSPVGAFAFYLRSTVLRLGPASRRVRTGRERVRTRTGFGFGRLVVAQPLACTDGPSLVGMTNRTRRGAARAKGRYPLIAVVLVSTKN